MLARGQPASVIGISDHVLTWSGAGSSPLAVCNASIVGTYDKTLTFEYEDRTDGQAAGCSESHGECTKLCGKRFNQLIDDDQCGAWLRSYAARAPIMKGDLDVFITRCDARRTQASSWWLLGLFISILGFVLLTIAFCTSTAPAFRTHKQASAPKSNTNCQRWAWWGFAIQCPTSTPKEARMLKKRTLTAWVWTRSRQNAIRAGRKPCQTTTTPPQETTTTTSDGHAPSTGLCRTRRNQSKFSNVLEVKCFSWFVVATNAAMRTEPNDTFPVRISSRQAGSLSSAG